MIEIEQSIGYRIDGDRRIETPEKVDNVYSTEGGKRYVVGYCERTAGAGVALIRALSESQIEEAKKLLDERDGGEYPDRIVAGPPAPYIEEDENDE